MDVVQLKDGSVEVVGSFKDILDIVRDKCGDDLAKLLEENDPADWESVFEADISLDNIEETLEKRDENGLLTADQIEYIYDMVQGAKENLLKVL